MPASSLLALLDDIASVLDDVTLMSKVAAKKTAGVLGDDLALNAQQVSGVHSERELPVVWAVAKGSLKNKAILVPAALLISAFANWAVIPLLMLGGLYLCFEGVEKLAHKYLHSAEEDAAHEAELKEAVAGDEGDFMKLEQDKIKGAVRTDFILSAEIIVIALGTIAAMPIGQQIAVLVIIALGMTVGVYGLVAAIVKLDDLGLYLSARGGPSKPLGDLLLAAAPKLMKALSVIGTVAMFMVGGGILLHGVPALHHQVEAWAHAGGLAGELLLPSLAGIVAGLIAGAAALVVVTLAGKLFRRG
jgi:hypothetical protein